MPMDVQEYRRERLSAAAEKVGSKTELGRMLGYKDGAFVGQMLRGERPIKEGTVSKLESRPGFAGWFSGTPAGPSETTETLDAASRLASATQALAELMQPLSPMARKAASSVLAGIAESPEAWTEATGMLAALLGSNTKANPPIAELAPLVADLLRDISDTPPHQRPAAVINATAAVADVRSGAGIVASALAASKSALPPTKGHPRGQGTRPT